LFYEPGEVLHATFDKVGSTNHWTVSSRTLRDVVEYFGPKTDQLDWYFQDGKVTFTSYTEKIQSEREILKQPMHTSVVLERKDFDDFDAQEGLHIGTMVKDFRAIVAHAEAMRIHVTARYSRGNRPMQISYDSNGLLAEFTLMTRGSSNVPSSTNINTPARDLSMRPASRPPETPTATTPAATTEHARPTKADMPPPAARASFRDAAQPALIKSNSRDSAPTPSASIDPNSMFIPADDDDQQWDMPNFEEEPDIVTWDNTAEDVTASNTTRRIRDSEIHSFVSRPESESSLKRPFPSEIPPTQRLSQVRGLFD
jgi:cell cycle checkpoint control protein RAD9A